MGTHKNFTSAFKALYSKLERVKRDLPSVLANAGTNYFVSAFDTESWDGKKWQAPQRRIPGTKSFKYPLTKDKGRRTRKTLVKTSKLKREVNNSVRQKTFRRIVWKVSLPYAARHNEGLFGMPKRKYMGESRTLLSIFKRKITQAYKFGLK